MKKLLVLSLVLLIGVTCMAKRNYFDDLYIGGDVEVVGTTTFGAISVVGNLTVDGVLISLDGSTSVISASAGYVSTQADDIRLGLDADDYMMLVTSNDTANLAITHPGNTGALVIWTAGGWTLTGAFEIVGSTTLDDTLISTTLGIGTDLSMIGTTGVHDWFLTDSVVDALSIQRGTTDFIVLDTSTVSVDITGDIDQDGAYSILDGSTYVRLASAGYVNTESDDIRLGLDADDYMKLVTTNDTGNLAITHPGNTPAVTWTATSFDFTGTFAVDGFTASGIVSVDDATDTSSAVTGSIHTDGGLGVAKKVWVGTDLAVDGTSNLDDVDIDGTTQIDGTVTGGVSGTAYTWTWHSDSADDNMIWTDSTARLTLTGIDSTDVLTVADGDVSITDDLDVDGIANFDVVDIDDAVNIAGAVTQVGNLYLTGDTTQTGSVTITTDLDVDGTANLDNTDIDGTLNVQGVTTFQANTTVAAATNAGGIYVSTYNIVYTQTASITIFTLPANADIIDVVVMIQTGFDGSGSDLLNVGTADADAYVDDLDISSAAVHRTGDAQMLYANLGDVGGTALDVKAIYTDANTDASAGAATIYVYWTMGTPGSL